MINIKYVTRKPSLIFDIGFSCKRLANNELQNTRPGRVCETVRSKGGRRIGETGEVGKQEREIKNQAGGETVGLVEDIR